MRHLLDSIKSYFIAPAHDKSEGMYANSVRQLVVHEVKRDCYSPEIIGFNSRSYCRPLSMEAAYVLYALNVLAHIFMLIIYNI